MATWELHGIWENLFLRWAVVNPRIVFPQRCYNLRRDGTQQPALVLISKEMQTRTWSGERDSRSRKKVGKGGADAEKQ